MSSLTEPSSIVLLIGAIFILIFILHGLWFSNKPQNRKLKKNDQQDQALRKSQDVGKVRIVSQDVPNIEENDEGLTITRNSNNRNTKKQSTLSINEIEDSIQDYQLSASIHVNNRRNNMPDNDLGIEEVDVNDLNNMRNNAINTNLGVEEVSVDVLNNNNLNSMQSISNSIYNNELDLSNNEQSAHYYDLIIYAKEGQPYRGEDLEEICSSYGFIQGVIGNNNKVFFVYENAMQKSNEVFRICSLKAPYYFPEDMTDYKTPGLVLYMTLPSPGKALSYFKALRMAAKLIIDRLGGELRDNNHQLVDEARLEQMAKDIEEYDKQSNNA